MQIRLPRYLLPFNLTQLPHSRVEVAVIGAGVAGLRCSLRLADSYEVEIFAKGSPEKTNTWHAQGGVAAALAADDSAEKHAQDSLKTGAGLSDRPVVEKVTKAAPELIRKLVSSEPVFNRSENRLSLGREGGHSCARVVHASGDATGREISQILLDRVKNSPGINLNLNSMVVDLVIDQGKISGILVVRNGRLEFVETGALVLATGGLGQIYRETTNCVGTTGDAMAMALRSGLSLQDMEFIQFHPTVLYLPGAPRFLITEAVRGEGGIIRDISGERFLSSADPRAELAPRDLVSREILQRMILTDSSSVYLDLTEFSTDWLENRFPTVFSTCQSYGLDISRELIPVRPCAHYSMGGVLVELPGRTAVEGVYAVGETASTGFHGANRLASNSLLEGLVLGDSLGREILQVGLVKTSRPAGLKSSGLTGSRNLDLVDVRKSLQSTMWRYAGILRDRDRLVRARESIARWIELTATVDCRTPADLETINMLQLGLIVVNQALLRRESRGAHFRTDFQTARDKFRCHSTVCWDFQENCLDSGWRAVEQ